MSVRTEPALDPFTAEIMRSYLISTVREMVLTTTRTAFSTCFCHGEDFTCALFDRDGAMIAQDQGVTVHAGAMWEAVRYVIDTQPTISEGDVFLHNDPYHWGTHQADCMVCRPIFYQGERVGFAANRGHWTDVGGMAPGGWSGTAEDVIQEGLILSSIRLIHAGEINEDIRRFLLCNVRMVDQLWGDIQSQIASNIVAERRIRHLIDRYGLERFSSQRALCPGLFAAPLRGRPRAVARRSGEGRGCDRRRRKRRRSVSDTGHGQQDEAEDSGGLQRNPPAGDGAHQLLARLHQGRRRRVPVVDHRSGYSC